MNYRTVSRLVGVDEVARVPEHEHGRHRAPEHGEEREGEGQDTPAEPSYPPP